MGDPVDLGVLPVLFEGWLAGRPLAERSRREYTRNVRAYCAWLAITPDRDGWQGDPLTDPLARDHAARDFRRYLQVERKAAASTVNLALASLDALYRCLELGRPNVRRDKPTLAAPRALDEAAQRRLLRAAEAAPIRPRSLVMVMLFTALRISETVALDVDDVRIMTRKGVLQVIGKGEIKREVPLNALVRQVLDEWLAQRAVIAREGERALWVSRSGGRLSARSADRDVRAVAAAAGLRAAAAVDPGQVPPIDVQQLDQLRGSYSHLRPAMHAVLDAVQLRGSASSDDELLTTLRRVRAATGQVVEEPVELVPKAWRAWVQDPDGRVRRTRLELGLWFVLRDALRAGRVFRPIGRRYADPAGFLMPAEGWQANRSELAITFGRTLDADQRLQELEAEQKQALRRLQDAVDTGNGVRLVDGVLELSRPAALEENPAAVRLRQRSIVSRRGSIFPTCSPRCRAGPGSSASSRTPPGRTHG